MDREMELELIEACESIMHARMQEAGLKAGLTEADLKEVLLEAAKKGLRDPVIAAIRSRQLDYEIDLMTKRGLSNKEIARKLIDRAASAYAGRNLVFPESN